MVLSETASDLVIRAAHQHLGRSYVWQTYDCVNFVVDVYRQANIEMPVIDKTGSPPVGFHLSADEFGSMPLGHSIFLKRKASLSDRIWTHVAIIVSQHEVIHCSRHFGRKVVVTPVKEFLRVYTLAPK